MTARIDVTDIPAVSERQLMIPLDMLIARGRGLALLDGLDETTLAEIEDHVWRNLDVGRQEKLAVVLRFRALVEVFGARRLKALFLETGFALLAPAIATAAGLRLNARRGFSPQTYLVTLKAVLAEGHSRRVPSAFFGEQRRAA
ncbi:MAG: hypothetical protein AB1749_05070 [Pseudomonadota bacterium]